MARHSPLFGKGEADLGVEIFGRRKKWLFFARPRPVGGRAAGLGTFMLNHFGTQSGSSFTSPGNWAEPVEIWKAKNLIHQDPAGELSLTRVVDAVNVSPNHLSEKFKQVTGVNFVVYVSLLRFEGARLLLHDSKLRISEIDFAAGFQSLSQFNRIFKKLSSERRGLMMVRAKRSSPTFVRLRNSRTPARIDTGIEFPPACGRPKSRCSIPHLVLLHFVPG